MPNTPQIRVSIELPEPLVLSRGFGHYVNDCYLAASGEVKIVDRVIGHWTRIGELD